MALVTILLSAYNDGANHVDLTYDDVTLRVETLWWTNPTGHWTFIADRGGGQTIVRTLNPGDVGSVSVGGSWQWALVRGTAPNFVWNDAWSAA